MKYLLPNLFLSAILTLLSCVNADDTPITPSPILWYDEPASVWEEALPLGNGRLGVMVFGKTSNERIQLNDDSMWPADIGWKQTDGNQEDLAHIRQLLREGKNAEADQLMVDKFSRKGVIRSHQTLGELYLNFDHPNITEYRRELDLDKAVSTVSYKSNGNLITEKVFVSHPHRAILITFSSEAEEGLNGRVSLSRPDDHGQPTVTVHTNEDKLLVMEGMVTQRGGKFNSEAAPIL